MRILRQLASGAAAIAAVIITLTAFSSAVSYNEDPLVAETGWGQVCARAMVQYFEGKVTIGVISGGELPSFGPMPKVGDVPDWPKLKDIDFVLVKMSGADLITAMGRSAKYLPRKNSNMLHLTGLQVFCKKNGQTNIVTAVTEGAKPIIPGDTYRVAATKFLATGGGPFVGLKSLEVVTKEPHSLQREIRFRLFPRGRIAEPVSSYVFMNNI